MDLFWTAVQPMSNDLNYTHSYFLLFTLSLVVMRRGDRVHPGVQVIYISAGPTFIHCASVNNSDPGIPIAVGRSEY